MFIFASICIHNCYIAIQLALSLEVTCNFKKDAQESNRVESTAYSRATTVVHTHEYPITLPMVGTGQMSKLNVRCLPIVAYCFNAVANNKYKCRHYKMHHVLRPGIVLTHDNSHTQNTAKLNWH